MTTIKRITRIENCSSLAPCDLSYLPDQRRFGLTQATEFYNRREFLARLWERLNAKSAGRFLPIRTITHDIIPAQSPAHRLTKGDFIHDGAYYLTQDIRLLSSLVQWFATKGGDAFLGRVATRERKSGVHPDHFFNVFHEEAQYRDVVAYAVQECTSRYGKATLGIPDLSAQIVSSRNRVVADGFMRWLASNPGRAFLAAYAGYKIRVQQHLAQQSSGNTHTPVLRRKGLYRRTRFMRY
jgi:hypothetical protein